MGGIFDINNGFFRIINRIMDLILLNILWFVTSIPIVTIGASTTAAYYACMRMVRNEEGYVSSDFFRSFKQNFKQSTVIWLMCLFVGIVISTAWWFYGIKTGFFYKILKAFVFVVIVIYVFITLYIFPVQARFDNKVKVNLKNALLLSIRHLLTTLFMVVIVALILFGAWAVPLIRLIFVMLGVSGIIFTLSPMFNNIFNKYIPEEVLFPADPGIRPAPEEE